MNKPVGGRGKVAPYQTTHIRVPLPIKDRVQELIENYRQSLDGEVSSQDDRMTVEKAKKLAIKLLRSKTSKAETVAKLLTSIYGTEISKDDLT